MKIALIAPLILAGFVFFYPSHSLAAVRVRSYVTKRGTYVAPTHRQSPNTTKIDNYSTKGNLNPYTGKTGAKIIEPVLRLPKRR